MYGDIMSLGSCEEGGWRCSSQLIREVWMDTQVWESSCGIQVAVEPLGIETISRRTYRAEVINGQLKAKYGSRCV